MPFAPRKNFCPVALISADKTSVQALSAAALSVQKLKSLLRYDPATGEFTWVAPDRFGQRAGRQHKGYLRISLGRFGVWYAHRLAWLYMTGSMPGKFIDHIDCDRGNNRWVNLRLAEPDQNRANSKRTRRNVAGAKGVFPFRGGFRATICVHYQNIYLGDFNTIEEAAAAYAGAARVAFGEFARLA